MEAADWQYLFNLAVAGMGTIGGWFLRVVWDANKEVREDIRAIEKETAATYVRKDDFHNYMQPIRQQLDRIENKLDNKVDK